MKPYTDAPPLHLLRCGSNVAHFAACGSSSCLDLAVALQQSLLFPLTFLPYPANTTTSLRQIVVIVCSDPPDCIAPDFLDCVLEGDDLLKLARHVAEHKLDPSPASHEELLDEDVREETETEEANLDSTSSRQETEATGLDGGWWDVLRKSRGRGVGRILARMRDGEQRGLAGVATMLKFVASARMTLIIGRSQASIKV
eukprot:c17910_g1_i1.p1 GENE.c17910_g1_i1~~c17910_g1_i1.p1  ORF type:complete len:199 (-),score=34.32 c17910_g1_i1:85-681(-)